MSTNLRRMSTNQYSLGPVRPTTRARACVWYIFPERDRSQGAEAGVSARPFEAGLMERSERLTCRAQRVIRGWCSLTNLQGAP